MHNDCRGFSAPNTIVPFPLPPFLLLLLRSGADLQGSSSPSRQAACRSQPVQIQAGPHPSAMMTLAPANPPATIALSTPQMASTTLGTQSQTCGRIPGTLNPVLIMIITIIIPTMAHLTVHGTAQMENVNKGQMEGSQVGPMMIHMGLTAAPMALMAFPMGGHMGGSMGPTRAPHSTGRTCTLTPQRSQLF